jgi:hypothetical protein
LIKGAVQRVDNRGYVCPSGKTTLLTVQGFFVRNHFKIAFSKVSRLPLQILTEKLELFWGPATTGAKNGKKFLTTGPTQNLPSLEKEDRYEN